MGHDHVLAVREDKLGRITCGDTVVRKLNASLHDTRIHLSLNREVAEHSVVDARLLDECLLLRAASICIARAQRLLSRKGKQDGVGPNREITWW